MLDIQSLEETIFQSYVLHCRVAGRELQKWQPDDGADSNSFMMNDDGLGWDQFGVNKTKFGEWRCEQPLS